MGRLEGAVEGLEPEVDVAGSEPEGDVAGSERETPAEASEPEEAVAASELEGDVAASGVEGVMECSEVRSLEGSIWTLEPTECKSSHPFFQKVILSTWSFFSEHKFACFHVEKMLKKR